MVDMFMQVFIEREDGYHRSMVTVKLYLNGCVEILQSLYLDERIFKAAQVPGESD